MITLYHNPRCSKSREALALVEAASVRLGEPLTVVEYLKTPPDLATLTVIAACLDQPVRTLLREGDEAFAALGLNAGMLDDSAVLQLLVTHPALLQRPLLVRDNKAVIGRPPEAILRVLDRGWC